MKIFWFFSLILLGAFVLNAKAPLQGIHTIRQSDTIFAAYSYCTQGTEFLKPKVAHSGTTSGVAIGEFPLYSYLVSLPCQIRGTWSELDPKFFILLFWVLNFLVWLAWARIYLKPHDPGVFVMLLGFSTFALLYMTISLPDNLAFLLIGLAAYLQARFWNESFPKNKKFLISLLSSLLFILAFAVRPYLIPLILLVHRRWLWMVLTTFGCIVVYIFWYKIWAQNSELNYYYLAIPPLSEVIETLPKYGLPLLGNILRQIFQYIFILPLLWKWRSLKAIEVLGLIGTILLLVAARGEHLVIHGYYLWAAAVFGALCLFRVLIGLPRKFQIACLVVYGMIGVAQTQHEFHAQKAQTYQQLQNLLILEKIPQAAKIAVFVGDGSCSTQYLYWMKHHGWCIYEKEFKGPESCPKGADFYFRFNDKGDPILKPCAFVPTEKPTGK